MEPEIDHIPEAEDAREIDHVFRNIHCRKLSQRQAEDLWKHEDHQEKNNAFYKAEDNDADELRGDPEIENVQADDKKTVKMRNGNADGKH